MKIAIASDHHGFLFKREMKRHLRVTPHEVVDLGCLNPEAVHYPDLAFKLADYIKAGKADRGILICGTGIGMAIAANKVPGVRAALCHDACSAERAVASNDAQILTMGANIIAPTLGAQVMHAFLAAETVAPSSVINLKKISDYELNQQLSSVTQGGHACSN